MRFGFAPPFPPPGADRYNPSAKTFLTCLVPGDLGPTPPQATLRTLKTTTKNV